MSRIIITLGVFCLFNITFLPIASIILSYTLHKYLSPSISTYNISLQKTKDGYISKTRIDPPRQSGRVFLTLNLPETEKNMEIFSFNVKVKTAANNDSINSEDLLFHLRFKRKEYLIVESILFFLPILLGLYGQDQALTRELHISRGRFDYLVIEVNENVDLSGCRLDLMNRCRFGGYFLFKYRTTFLCTGSVVFCFIFFVLLVYILLKKKSYEEYDSTYDGN
jgi:hypothetical protein